MDRRYFPYEARAAEVDVYETLRDALDSEDDDAPPLETPIWYFPLDYIIETVHLLEWGILPDAGGWNDQNEFWVLDVRQYLRIRAAVLRKRSNDERARRDGGKDPLAELFGEADGAATDWGAFTGG